MTRPLEFSPSKIFSLRKNDEIYTNRSKPCWESLWSLMHFNLCSLSQDFRSYILVLETSIKIFEDSKMIFNAQADTSRDEKWMPALIIKFKL